MKSLRWLVLAVSLLNVGATHSQTRAVDPLKELMIVDRLVVEDARANPGGPWHFGTLIREMLPADATDAEVSDFVIAWLEEWATVAQINGFPVGKRPSVRNAVICPWRNASAGTTDCTGVLDMKKAPFRLIAIANRIDVMKPGQAGEGRFAYAVLGGPTETPTSPSSFAMSFSLLLNYALPVSETKNAVAWAKEWHALSDLPCEEGNCGEYLSALTKITDGFTRRNLQEGKPQGNPFIELHSNEIALGSPWELRQFVLASTERGLRMVQSTVNKTPAKSLNNSPSLIAWAEAHQEAILSETHAVPKEMLGGMAHESFGTENQWKLGTLPEEVRFKFSKNTCNGCHREEAAQIPAVDGFYHIAPTGESGKSRLSPWLLDTELPRRASFIEALLAEK